MEDVAGSNPVKPTITFEMETTVKIKDVVSKEHVVSFDFFRQGKFYYNVYNINETPYGPVYQFVVPIEEVGDATFNASDKSVYFMRFIRKAMDNGEFVKVR